MRNATTLLIMNCVIILITNISTNEAIHIQENHELLNELEKITSENVSKLDQLITLSSIENIHSVAFSPDGTFLAFADQISGTVYLWDITKETITPLLKDVWDVTFSQDLAFVSGSIKDNEHSIFPTAIQIWNLDIGERVAEIPYSGPIHDMAFGPDNRQLAIASGWAADTFAVQLWQIEKLFELHSWRGYRWANNVAFNPQGSSIAIAYTTRITIFDVKTGNNTATMYQYLPLNDTHQIGHQVTSLAFNSDGSLLASISPEGFVWVWDAQTGEAINSLRGDTPWDITETLYLYQNHGVTFSPDDALLVGTGGNVINIWDLTTGELLKTLDQGASSVIFSPDGTLIASVDWDSTIRLWGIVSD